MPNSFKNAAAKLLLLIMINKCCEEPISGKPVPNIAYTDFPFPLSDNGDCTGHETLYRVTIIDNGSYNYTSPDMDLAPLGSLIQQKIDSIATLGEFHTYTNWERTIGTIVQADRWRINGGTDIMFPSGMVLGTAIFSEIIATLPQVNIVGISVSGVTATITTIYNQITTMEIFNGTQWEPLANITTNNTTPAVLKYPPTPSTCFTVSIYASKCDGTEPGSVAGNSIAFSFVPHDDAFVNYSTVAHSPFTNAELGVLNNSNELLAMLNADPDNINAVSYLTIFDNSLGTVILTSGAECGHIPASFHTK